MGCCCRDAGPLQVPGNVVALGLMRSMSGSCNPVVAPTSLQPSPVSTTGCSKHDKIVDLASLLDRGLRLMDRVVRDDAIVTLGSATDSGWCRISCLQAAAPEAFENSKHHQLSPGNRRCGQCGFACGIAWCPCRVPGIRCHLLQR